MFEHDCLDTCCFGCLIYMYVFCIFVFAPVQRNWACFTWNVSHYHYYYYSVFTSHFWQEIVKSFCNSRDQEMILLLVSSKRFMVLFQQHWCNNVVVCELKEICSTVQVTQAQQWDCLWIVRNCGTVSTALMQSYQWWETVRFALLFQKHWCMVSHHFMSKLMWSCLQKSCFTSPTSAFESSLLNPSSFKWIFTLFLVTSFKEQVRQDS